MITMAIIDMLIVMLIFLQDESAARVVYCTHEVNSRTCHAIEVIVTPTPYLSGAPESSMLERADDDVHIIC